MRKTNLRALRKSNPKEAARTKRKVAVRKRVQTDSDRLRLSVFRSARHIYAQIIDDAAGKTLVQASTLDKGVRDAVKGKKKSDASKEVGKAVADRAKKA